MCFIVLVLWVRGPSSGLCLRKLGLIQSLSVILKCSLILCLECRRLLSLLQKSPKHFCPVSLLLSQLQGSEEVCYSPGIPWVHLKWPGSPSPIVSSDTVLFHGVIVSFIPYMSHSSWIILDGWRGLVSNRGFVMLVIGDSPWRWATRPSSCHPLISLVSFFSLCY